jgi:hypothetical protein
MTFTKESLKYRSEVLKYVGFGLCTPFGSIVINAFSDKDYLHHNFSMLYFLLSIIILCLGSLCIERGLDILEEYGDNL